jgi:hypothetical protein
MDGFSILIALAANGGGRSSRRGGQSERRRAPSTLSRRGSGSGGGWINPDLSSIGTYGEFKYGGITDTEFLRDGYQ